MSNTTYGAIKLATAEDVGAVLKKKTGTVNGYKPKEWADTINLMGLLPIRTASGAIAHFEDGADDVPCVSVVVNIVPYQEGTGDPSPSNPRPIIGTSVLNVKQRGKNFAKIKPYSDWTIGSTYGYIDGDLPKNTRLTMSLTVKDPDVSVSGCYFGFVKGGYAGESLLNDSYKWVLNNGNYNSSSNTPANGDTSIFLSDLIIYPRTEATYDKIFSRFNVQIELGLYSTTYEPYTGLTYTIALGRTVYGGSAEVDEGAGEETLGFVTLDGTEGTWGSSSSYNFRVQIPTMKNGDSLDGLAEWLATWKTSSETKPSVRFGANTTYLYFYNIIGNVSGVTDLASWKIYLANHPLKLAYPLATPTEYTFTGQVINSLEGVNNIWHDGNGTTEVEYRADIDLLITELGG